MELGSETNKRSLYRVDEVCGVTGVKPYVLRFWETEFPEIAPVTSPNGQKLYEEKDIEVVHSIKKLLYEDKLSIEKARLKILEQMREKDREKDDQHFDDRVISNTGVALESSPDVKENQLWSNSGPSPISSKEEQKKLQQVKENLQQMMERLEAIQKRFHWI